MVLAIGAGGIIGPIYGMTRTAASSNGRNGDGRGRCGMTVAAVVHLGQLEGEGSGHRHLVGLLGPDGLFCHPASEEASGQGIDALFQHAPEDEVRDHGVVTSNSRWGCVVEDGAHGGLLCAHQCFSRETPARPS